MPQSYGSVVCSDSLFRGLGRQVRSASEQGQPGSTPCPAPSGCTGRNRVSNRPRSGDRGPGDAGRPPDWRARLPRPPDEEVPGYEFDVPRGRPGTGEFAALRDTGEFGAVRDTGEFGRPGTGEFGAVRDR